MTKTWFSVARGLLILPALLLPNSGDAAGIRALHERSGSTQEFRKFAYDVRQFVARTQAFPMPDFDLRFVDGKEEHLLCMIPRGDNATAAQPELPAAT